MSKDTQVFNSKLESDINYELHVTNGFSGRSEVALMIEGEFVSITSIEKKRGGNIYCRPIDSKSTLIKKDKKEGESIKDLNFDDVISK